MIREIDAFTRKFAADISPDWGSVVKRHGRYFLLSENLKALLPHEFFSAGIYLGTIRDGDFTPGFGLLRMIADGEANKVFVDEKTEWLFICGRDVFRKGVLKATGSQEGGSLTIVLNRRGECIGFGRLVHCFGTKKGGIAVENMLDVGDFLRRER